MRLAVWEGTARVMGVSLHRGVFLAGFAAAAGADERAMGFIGAMPAAGQLLQVVAAQIIAAAGGRRRVFIAVNVLAALIWVGVTAAAFRLAQGPLFVWIFVLVYGLDSFCTSTGQLAWLAWMRDLIPASLRGRYFARRNRLVLLAALVLSVPAAHFVDRVRAAQPSTALRGYSYVFAVSALLMGASVLIARRVHEPAIPTERPARLWQTAARAAWASRPFRRYLVFRLYMGFAMSTTGPLFIYYLVREAGYSSTFVAGLNVVGTVVAAATLLLWGKLADRVGYRPAMLLTLTLKAAWCGLWIFVGRDAYGLLVFVYILGAVGSGNAMLHNNMLMKLAPGQAPVATMALFNSLTRTVSIAGPIVGGFLVHSLLPRQLSISGLTLSNWQLLFLLSTVLRGVGVAGLLWVQEPGSMPLRRFIRLVFRGFTAEEPIRTVTEEDEDTSSGGS